jgi:hypothetical protein
MGEVAMRALDAFPPLLIGVLFTVLGCLKVYGVTRGMVGGGGKPLWERLCGT